MLNQNGVISLVLAFNQFVNPWALEVLGWKYVRCNDVCRHSQFETDKQTVLGVLWVAPTRIHLCV